jgi:S1-C subfamily serine protease
MKRQRVSALALVGAGITVGVFYLASVPRPPTAPSGQPPRGEIAIPAVEDPRPPAGQSRGDSEFSSVDEARAVEKQLRAACDAVAPAVVRLSRAHDQKLLQHGSGVVIHPSGLILTHGHHQQARGSTIQATFPDGTAVDATVEGVYSGRGRDFSLLKIQKPGPYPAAALRGESLCTAGQRCFHLG